MKGEMTDAQENQSSEFDPTTGSRRQHGRVRCEIVESNMGPVIDASAGGMRINFMGRGRIKLGMMFDLSIVAQGDSFTVPVEVIWIKRRGFFKRDFGVRFIEVTPKLKKALNAMARSSASNYSFLPPDEMRNAS